MCGGGFASVNAFLEDGRFSASEWGTHPATGAFNPLVSAAKNGHVGVCVLLLDYYIDYAQCALFTAVRAGHSEVCDVLLKRGASADKDVLHFAASRGDSEVCDVLLRHGAPVDKDVLHIAAEMGYTNVCGLLLRRCAPGDKRALRTEYRRIRAEHKLITAALQKPPWRP